MIALPAFGFIRSVRYAFLMQLNQRSLIGLPVRTRGGDLLGKSSELIINTETGRVDFIVVGNRRPISNFIQPELRIAWSQIIRVTSEEIKVDDAAIAEPFPHLASGMA